MRGVGVDDVGDEAIHLRSGTSNVVIEGCTIDRAGLEQPGFGEGIYGGDISGENFADSFVDLKGDAAQVRSNRFYKEGNATVTRGVAIVDRTDATVVISARNNWIYDNDFQMDDENGLMVHAYSGTDNHAWNNTRTPAGEEYNGNAPELYLSDPR